MGNSSRQPTRAGLIRRAALIGSIVAVVGIATTATLLYTQRASHAAGAGCDIPANQQSATCNYSGLTAVAIFDSTSPDGCVETGVSVLASNGVTRNPSLTIASGTGVNLGISQWDNCQSMSLVSAFGTADNVNFTEDSSLNSATLSATVTVTDYAQAVATTYPVTINLTWQGYGAISQVAQGNTHQRFGSWVVNGQFHGESRSATVTGSIWDGTTEYGTLPVTYSNLENASGGWEYIHI